LRFTVKWLQGFYEIDVRARFARDFLVGPVTKIAIDKQPHSSENRGHEELLAGVLLASGRVRGEEAAGCDNAASCTKPVAALQGRTH
jgi:hypothetical protein